MIAVGSLLAFHDMPRSGDRPDATAKARKKHSSIIVASTAVHLRGAPVIDLTTLDALVDVAKKYETMIVELPLQEGHEYLLWDDGMVFRFREVEEQDDAATPLAQLRGAPDDET